MVEFHGEVYPPYRWFEKEDEIRRLQKKEVAPEFYNIMLERPKVKHAHKEGEKIACLFTERNCSVDSLVCTFVVIIAVEICPKHAVSVGDLSGFLPAFRQNPHSWKSERIGSGKPLGTCSRLKLGSVNTLSGCRLCLW